VEKVTVITWRCLLLL